MTILTNTVQPECLLLSPRMPRRILRGPMEFISGNLRTFSYFDFRTLRRATKNFHPRNLLGSGGFGPVYQKSGGFVLEIRVSENDHKHPTQKSGSPSRMLLRWPSKDTMKNKSLDLIIYVILLYFISTVTLSDQFLKWSTRFQTILGVARGLQYLHEDSLLRIVHRDIKASNILLDEKFQPRIGDFGLARFFPEDQAYLSTQFAGTLGYTAPEYAIRGELSEKADIYCFGVLVLEIISCRKNTLPSEQQYLPEYAWKLYEKSMLVEIVNPKLREHGIEEKDVMQTFHVPCQRS
ncbi:putative LRR receptor-like serine/threonine-protein kinase [Glycine max]|nr:putative LRR receptor-like serine/threonine-protein kinase [Glycine max]